MQFDHIGVPTQEQKEGEIWISATRVWVTEAQKHPFRVEWLRFAEDSPVATLLQTTAHVAYRVPDLDAAIAGQKFSFEPL